MENGGGGTYCLCLRAASATAACSAGAIACVGPSAASCAIAFRARYLAWWQARSIFPEQDTFYLRALQLELPPSVRLALDVQRVMSDFELIRRKSELESPWQAALRNMTLSQRVFTPDPREIVQRQVAIASATSMPIWRTGQSAPVSIPVSAIGSFLGLTEDVSPRISYRVRQTAYVQAVVYSTTALIVRRLFAGEQRPGVYDLEWDGRDDKGRSLPEGDYVIEVRIGTENIVRKRVVLSSR